MARVGGWQWLQSGGIGIERHQGVRASELLHDGDQGVERFDGQPSKKRLEDWGSEGQRS